MIEIFGELSSGKLRAVLEELNISTKFSDYGISEEELEALRLSLQGNQRAGNSLANLPENKIKVKDMNIFENLVLVGPQ